MLKPLVYEFTASGRVGYLWDRDSTAPNHISLSHLSFLTLWDCGECLPPTIRCTSTLRRFFFRFFFLKGPLKKGGWSECVFSLLCNIIWLWNFCRADSGLLSVQSVHLCIVHISFLNRKSLLTAVIIHAWAQHFFLFYQRLSWIPYLQSLEKFVQ